MKSSIPNLARMALPLALSLLGGCSSFGGGDIGSIYAAVKSSWTGGDKVSLQEAASVPYASIGLRLGDSAQIMLLLVSESGGQLLWTSSARMAITTENGRIIHTGGFGHDLGGHTLVNSSTEPDGSKIIRWQADFPDQGLYSVLITCHDHQAGNETISILGKDIHTQRIDERCSSDEDVLDWSFSNTYWVDPDTGLVWRSIQHVSPNLDAIEIETLRPPA